MLNILKFFHVFKKLLNHAVSLSAACIKCCLLMSASSKLLSRPRSVTLALSLSLGSLQAAHTHTDTQSEIFTIQLTANGIVSCAVAEPDVVGGARVSERAAFKFCSPRNM